MDPIIASKNPKLKILGNTVLRNLLALFSFNDLNAAGVTMDTKKIIDPNNNEKIIDDMFIFFLIKFMSYYLRLFYNALILKSDNLQIFRTKN